MSLRREQSYFDLMNIIIGAIVQRDIYVVSGIAAGLLCPFSIVVWSFAGVMSTAFRMTLLAKLRIVIPA